MKAKYVQGEGCYILFDDSKCELETALDVLYAIADRYNTDGLDPLIILLNNCTQDPPSVYRLCELCWKPIDTRIQKVAIIQTKHFHTHCLASKVDKGKLQ